MGKINIVYRNVLVCPPPCGSHLVFIENNHGKNHRIICSKCGAHLVPATFRLAETNE